MLCVFPELRRKYILDTCNNELLYGRLMEMSEGQTKSYLRRKHILIEYSRRMWNIKSVLVCERIYVRALNKCSECRPFCESFQMRLF